MTPSPIPVLITIRICRHVLSFTNLEDGLMSYREFYKALMMRFVEKAW